MPILIKDYSWTEDTSTIYVKLPLKGVKSNRVDIFGTDEYIKISYPPYLFEAWLYDFINFESSTTQIGNGLIFLKLTKCNEVLWNQICHPDSGDKVKYQTIRVKSNQVAHEIALKKQNEKSEEKRELNKLAVSEQISLEDTQRKERDASKQKDKDNALQDLDSWKNKLSDGITSKLRSNKHIGNTLPSSHVFRNKEKKSDENVPPPRSKSTLSISFTDRVFPTAARESMAQEEETWLKKQVENRRIVESFDKELLEHEKDPSWIIQKGISLFESGDYQGGISVFNHGIRLNRNIPTFYSNRGACHLKVGNFMKCLEDCSEALKLLTPPVTQNAKNRFLSHIRRGTAFCNLELYAEGLLDYEAAFKIDPDEKVNDDINKIRCIIEGQPL